MKRIILLILMTAAIVLVAIMNPAPGGVEGAYRIHVVTVGSKTARLVVISNAPETATIEGMEATLRRAVKDIGKDGTMAVGAADVLVAQPGLGSSAYAERQNFAKMALSSGKECVVSVDMSDRFKWPWESGDLRMVVIDESVTRRFERLVSAANRVWGGPPDVVLESQATRLICPGTPGSITAADLCEKSKLHKDFKLNRVVCVGVPLRDLEVGRTLKEKRIGEVVAITTPQAPVVIGAAPLRGEAGIDVTLRDGKPVRHKYLFKERWPDGQVNPIPEMIGHRLSDGY